MAKDNRLTNRLKWERFEDSQKIQRLLTDIDELKGRWIAGVKLSPQILSKLKRSVVIASTGSSTRIEGAELTDEQIEKLFKGLKIKKFATRDEQEVAGYKGLLENIFDFWEKIKFNESTIKHFYKELLKYSEKDKKHLGNYKFGSNRVEAVDVSGKVVGVVFEPTPPHLTPKEMSELIEWTQNAFKENLIHPLLIIGNFVLEFLAIHPFQDGNGRTSRVLTNFLMLRAGYEYMPYVSHEKFVEDNKSDYYPALRKSQGNYKKRQSNIAPWMIFFLTILLEQAKMAIEINDSERIELFLSEKQFKVWQYFQDHEFVASKDIRENLGIKEATVLQIFNKLLYMKKIERLGMGRGVRYRKI
ncbi:Fic family protein [Candidatus Falkowbacteria bacterium]|nr:MAG: Fic family protein [Candidatus Falkowbacteria bacterium]